MNQIVTRATVKAQRRNCNTFEERDVDVTLELREESNGQRSVWLIGGPTGYESFIVHADTVKGLSNGWMACFGTDRRWDRMYVPPESMKVAFKAFGLIE